MKTSEFVNSLCYQNLLKAYTEQGDYPSIMEELFYNSNNSYTYMMLEN